MAAAIATTVRNDGPIDVPINGPLARAFGVVAT
jgi:hypothetical protein